MYIHSNLDVYMYIHTCMYVRYIHLVYIEMNWVCRASEIKLDLSSW